MLSWFKREIDIYLIKRSVDTFICYQRFFLCSSPLTMGCLRSQSFLFPATIFLKYILNAVVQAAFPPLPEFEAGRSYGQNQPQLSGRLFHVPPACDLFYESPHNLHTTTYHPALRRNPCTYLAFIGSAGKVSIRHLVEAFSALPSMCTCLSNLCHTKEREIYGLSANCFPFRLS